MSIEKIEINLAVGRELLSFKPKDLADNILIGFCKDVIYEIENNTDIPPSTKKRYLREFARVNNMFCDRVEKRDRSHDVSHLVINLEDYK